MFWYRARTHRYFMLDFILMKLILFYFCFVKFDFNSFMVFVLLFNGSINSRFFVYFIIIIVFLYTNRLILKQLKHRFGLNANDMCANDNHDAFDLNELNLLVYRKIIHIHRENMN